MTSFQIHDVEFAENEDIILNETLPVLQQAKEAGKARYLGITGYDLDVLKYAYCSHGGAPLGLCPGSTLIFPWGPLEGAPRGLWGFILY